MEAKIVIILFFYDLAHFDFCASIVCIELCRSDQILPTFWKYPSCKKPNLTMTILGEEKCKVCPTSSRGSYCSSSWLKKSPLADELSNSCVKDSFQTHLGKNTQIEK